jgi:hypothetical protein
VSLPSRASEFPNDNPSVSEGAIWVCPEVRSHARSWLRPVFAPSSDSRLITVEDAALPPVIVESAPPQPAVDAAPALDAELEAEVAAEPQPESGQPAPPAPRRSEEPPACDGFAAFVAALSDVAQAQGASRAAAFLPLLLGSAPLRAGALGAGLEKALAAGGILAPASRKRTVAFEQTASAWRSVLSGETDDLSACGTTTLDRFGAELLCSLLDLPKSCSEELRRELRRRGVAAFGMIAHAA